MSWFKRLLHTVCGFQLCIYVCGFAELLLLFHRYARMTNFGLFYVGSENNTCKLCTLFVCNLRLLNWVVNEWFSYISQQLWSREKWQNIMSPLTRIYYHMLVLCQVSRSKSVITAMRQFKK